MVRFRYGEWADWSACSSNCGSGWTQRSYSCWRKETNETASLENCEIDLGVKPTEVKQCQSEPCSKNYFLIN